MAILCVTLAASCALASPAFAQQDSNPAKSSPPPAPPSQSSPAQSSPTPAASSEKGESSSDKGESSSAPSDPAESSSRDTLIDTAPPKDDSKNHPNSEQAISDLAPPPSDATNSDVQEFHPWNPFKANKDIKVGDFYFNRKNYKAALDRYKEALYYKQNDALATFRAAECEEKLGNKEEARKYFEQYLKILPDGPRSKEAQASLAKLQKAK